MCVLEYQKSLQNLDKAHGNLSAIVITVKNVAQSFEGWEKVDPPALNGTLERSLNTWPSKDILAAVVIAWKRSWSEAMDLWNSIPQNERLGLKSPREIKWE